MRDWSRLHGTSTPSTRLCLYIIDRIQLNVTKLLRFQATQNLRQPHTIKYSGGKLLQGGTQSCCCHPPRFHVLLDIVF